MTNYYSSKFTSCLVSLRLGRASAMLATNPCMCVFSSIEAMMLCLDDFVVLLLI